MIGMLDRSRMGLRIGRRVPRPPGTPPLIPRVVVKLHDTIDLPYQDDVEELFERWQIGSWKALQAQFPGITLSRLYTTLSPTEIQRLVSRAVQRDPSYHPPNFLSYFAVEI